jgi:D-amino-acid dehydrogenase
MTANTNNISFASTNMHVVVIGAGVIGVTTAWVLRKEGHTVDVIEREPRAADGTSFANAGQLSYGYAMPWAMPGVPLKALGWMFQKDAPFKLHLDREQPLRQLKWLAAMFKQCNEQEFERNKADMLAISYFSKKMLAELRRDVPGLAFDHQARGTLQLFRTEEELEAGKRDAVMLKTAGVQCELITDLDVVRSLEPALAHTSVKLFGGLYLKDDETGDCNLFTLQLAEAAARAGVNFHYGEEVIGWQESGKSHRLLQTSRNVYDYDAMVVCAGSYTADLLRPLGIDLRSRLYPVKGYSLTVDIDVPERAPVSTVMDEKYKVAITRLGNRIRVGGTAELSGFNRILREGRRATLASAVSELFPGSGNVDSARFWTGLRPSTPTGVPVIGNLPAQRIWANFGHGTLGWTMAAGSAQILALSLEGRSHELPPEVRRAVTNGLGGK